MPGRLESGILKEMLLEHFADNRISPQEDCNKVFKDVWLERRVEALRTNGYACVALEY